MLALTALGACSNKPQELTVRSAEESIPLPPAIRPLPDPAPIHTVKFDWMVVTEKTVPQGPFVLFALTPEGYENLALNSAETLRWITEAKRRLQIYREALQ